MYVYINHTFLHIYAHGHTYIYKYLRIMIDDDARIACIAALFYATPQAIMLLYTTNTAATTTSRNVKQLLTCANSKSHFLQFLFAGL